MTEKQKLKRQWLIYAGTGLALTGFGACLIAEAAMLKYDGAANQDWILAGTGALVVFNAGLSVFGTGVVKRSRLDQIPDE